MRVTLVRWAYLPSVTLGTLVAGDLQLATLEEPWRADPDGPGGQRREGELLESCVPDGTYRLDPHSGAKWKDVWALHAPHLGVWHWSVPPTVQGYGRSAILIHSGVDTSSILGCILVGLKHGFDQGRWRVYESPKALDQLRRVLGTSSPHELVIRPTMGTSEALCTWPTSPG